VTLEILSNDILFRAWHTLRQVRFAFTAVNGQKREATHEVLERRDASVILLHRTDADSIVLVRQWRIAAVVGGHEGPLLEACAGLIDQGETPLQAALREAEEETGYRPAAAEFIFTIVPSPGVITEKLHLFHASVTAEDRLGAGGGVEHESEDIEIVELPVAEIAAMVNRGQIADAKTLIALQWFLARRAAEAA